VSFGIVRGGTFLIREIDPASRAHLEYVISVLSSRHPSKGVEMDPFVIEQIDGSRIEIKPVTTHDGWRWKVTRVDEAGSIVADDGKFTAVGVIARIPVSAEPDFRDWVIALTCGGQGMPEEILRFCDAWSNGRLALADAKAFELREKVGIAKLADETVNAIRACVAQAAMRASEAEAREVRDA
jgi:hypothetical protein